MRLLRIFIPSLLPQAGEQKYPEGPLQWAPGASPSRMRSHTVRLLLWAKSLHYLCLQLYRMPLLPLQASREASNQGEYFLRHSIVLLLWMPSNLPGISRGRNPRWAVHDAHRRRQRRRAANRGADGQRGLSPQEPPAGASARALRTARSLGRPRLFARPSPNQAPGIRAFRMARRPAGRPADFRSGRAGPGSRYQRVHSPRPLGFMGEPAGHWKTCAKSELSERAPMTRKFLGACTSDRAEARAASSRVTPHQVCAKDRK
mmetsp:Transcript_28869/g.60637  ORF Transcript_28869/g.60637 Transcript_28869/m.60637 type:complete len:260 (-) Transcript_28869:2272-3051(-)